MLLNNTKQRAHSEMLLNVLTLSVHTSFYRKKNLKKNVLQEKEAIITEAFDGSSRLRVV